MYENNEDTELAALKACDVPAGLSTEGYIPAKIKLASLLERGLIEIVKTEIVGGWRQYDWFRTTEKGREFYATAPTSAGI